ncbi:hypothetical protein [Rhizobium wuzhouense]|uniref:hypothetical protein n=1 Tax=Rhizobium wuzhouense TaxID=1986026 RepID=UPI00105771AA|nr:hypothetical protein [Rhizobium wuzhouense]
MVDASGEELLGSDRRKGGPPTFIMSSVATESPQYRGADTVKLGSTGKNITKFCCVNTTFGTQNLTIA